MVSEGWENGESKIIQIEKIICQLPFLKFQFQVTEQTDRTVKILKERTTKNDENIISHKRVTVIQQVIILFPKSWEERSMKSNNRGKYFLMIVL